MTDKNEEFINPDSWTVNELVKYLYREVNTLNEKNEKLEETVRDMELAQEKMMARADEREKEVDRKISRTNNWVAIAGVLVSVAAVLISIFL